MTTGALDTSAYTCYIMGMTTNSNPTHSIEAGISYILDEGVAAIDNNDNQRHARAVAAYATFCGVDHDEAAARILGTYDALTGGSRFDRTW